ncbi:hypothetical protein KAT95_02930 [Candidatus Parcubacteria bacterium]|nr:hypothetical protein [Candidatus Parcubacteria bacterium]
MNEDYISLTEAIRYCDYSQEYLSLRARQGKLKAVKFDRNWVTKKEWLDEYLKTNSRKNNKEKRVIFQKALDKKISLPRLRYALEYIIAGVLVFCLLTTGVVFDFNKDIFWSIKDTLIKTGTELSITASDTMFGVVKASISIPKFSIPINITAKKQQISLFFSGLHPIQDFKDTINFVAKNSSKGISFISQKTDDFLNTLTIIIGGSIVNSKPFLNQALIQINNSVYEWRKGVIARSDELEAETKSYFYNLGASILLTSKNTHSFLAEAGADAEDSLTYVFSVFQRFTQWYKEQAIVVGQKIVNTGIIFRQDYQNANDFIENRIFLAW